MQPILQISAEMFLVPINPLLDGMEVGEETKIDSIVSMLKLKKKRETWSDAQVLQTFNLHSWGISIVLILSTSDNITLDVQTSTSLWVGGALRNLFWPTIIWNRINSTSSNKDKKIWYTGISVDCALFACKINLLSKQIQCLLTFTCYYPHVSVESHSIQYNCWVVLPYHTMNIYLQQQ